MVWGSSFEKDEAYIQEHAEKIKEYYHSTIEDFEYVEGLIKKIKNKLNRDKSAEYLIIDMNKQIDIDFIKESEEIENNFSKGLMDFLKDPDTRIIEALPIDVVYIAGRRGAEYEDIRRKAFSKSKLLAENIRLHKTKEINCKSHLYALRNLFNQARLSRRNKCKKGSFSPLTNDLIIDTQEMLMDEAYGSGGYRSAYTFGLTFVAGAQWTPVSNARVSDRMDALLRWYNEDSDLNPIEKAAILHTEFIKIHPFTDGNGRTARLLMNYELIKNGYPSVVIKSKDRTAYIKSLEKGIVTGDVSDFVSIIKDAAEKTAGEQLEFIGEVVKTNKRQKDNPRGRSK